MNEILLVLAGAGHYSDGCLVNMKYCLLQQEQGTIMMVALYK